MFSVLQNVTTSQPSGDDNDDGKPAEGRGALLGSIRSFSKTHLKRSNTIDKSQPNI